MSDVLSKEQRSYCMSQIKGSDTKPEQQLRKALWHLGFRYRLNSILPGKPDIVLTRFRTAIFVDGCFWHGCSKHMVKPRTRQEFWLAKIKRNRARDVEVSAVLRRQGWAVIRVWEHSVKADPIAVAERIEKQLWSPGGRSNDSKKRSS